MKQSDNTNNIKTTMKVKARVSNRKDEQFHVLVVFIVLSMWNFYIGFQFVSEHY